jgi:hypothetical protein
MVEAGGLTEREDTIVVDARVVRNRVFSIEYFVIAPRNDQKPGFEASLRRLGLY